MLDDPVSGSVDCVLDGLDECKETSLDVLLRQLAKHVETRRVSRASHPFKMIICSREYPNFIPDTLSSFPHIKLDGNSQAQVGEDILLFIDVKLVKLANLSAGTSPSDPPWPSTFCQHVRNFFLDRARGTFLWVGLVARDLEGKSPTEVEEALQGHPTGLDRLYARLLLQDHKDRRPIIAKILRWVTMAICPLTLSEFNAAIDLEFKSEHFIPIEKTWDYSRNCGFLKLEQATSNERSSSAATNGLSTQERHLQRTSSAERDIETIQHQYVHLIHQSAKDYLLRRGPDPDPELEFFRMTEYSATQEVATRCFLYLQDDKPFYTPFKGRFLEDTARLKAFPLLSYAVSHWHTHAKILDRTEDIFQLSLPFYQPQSKVRKLWLESMKTLGLTIPIKFVGGHDIIYELATDCPILHMASHFALLPVVQTILLTTNELRLRRMVVEMDSKGLTVLQRAAQCGHMAVVQLLLDKKANIDANGGFYNGTPLMLAIHNGHEKVARLLVEKGADVKIKDSGNATALSFAALCGECIDCENAATM